MLLVGDWNRWNYVSIWKKRLEKVTENMYLRTGIRYVGKGQKMMKYENGRLVLEIPAHIEEFDTIDLSAMFTYIVRKNPEIIKQMEIEKLSMETVLQEYYKIISHESLWLLARKYTKEYNGVKQVVSDTPEAGMAYRQLGETLEAELGEALKRDGYYVAELELEELGIELDAEEEVERNCD